MVFCPYPFSLQLTVVDKDSQMSTGLTSSPFKGEHNLSKEKALFDAKKTKKITSKFKPHSYSLSQTDYPNSTKIMFQSSLSTKEASRHPTTKDSKFIFRQEAPSIQKSEKCTQTDIQSYQKGEYFHSSHINHRQKRGILLLRLSHKQLKKRGILSSKTLTHTKNKKKQEKISKGSLNNNI